MASRIFRSWSRRPALPDHSARSSAAAIAQADASAGGVELELADELVVVALVDRGRGSTTIGATLAIGRAIAPSIDNRPCAIVPHQGAPATEIHLSVTRTR